MKPWGNCLERAYRLKRNGLILTLLCDKKLVLNAFNERAIRTMFTLLKHCSVREERRGEERRGEERRGEERRGEERRGEERRGEERRGVVYSISKA